MDENVSELVIKIQNGDNIAFEKLFNMYKTKAIRTAYLLTSNMAIADDVTQEAFVQCYLKINTLKNPELFKIWFFRILTRLAWKLGSKEKEVTPVENIFEFLTATDKTNIEHDFIKKESSKKIMDSINKLEQKQKTAVLLYYYKDFSISEIASIMGCFEGTVKSRLHSARKNLSKSIQMEETECLKEAKIDELIFKF